MIGQILCKPDEKKYIKTLKWKAELVDQIIGAHNLAGYKVIFVDDEARNRESIEQLGRDVQCYESLAQALEAIGDQDVTEDISPEADIIMQNVDPAVRNAYEEEMVNPSPRRQQDDGGKAIIV